MNPTETNSENTIPNDTTNETTQVSPVVTPPPALEVPTPASSSTSQSSVSAPSSPGLTSFPSNDESSSLNTVSTSSSAPISPNPIETIAKKEVVTRPLLWGIVTFLFFTGLVIGGVSLWRLYREQNPMPSNSMDTTMPAVTTDSVTTPANVIDNTPINANPSIQADAIDAEVQAIDSDIEADALSDTQLGL